jgi:flavin reductase (DIM6/NTAB) family NADH-FMN oxidoreductase RutF
MNTKEKKVVHADLEKMGYVTRINLVNSITGYKSASLIATQNKQGLLNVAVFSSVTHVGSNPPLVGCILRPTTVARNTYDNIIETGYYTINHINRHIIADAHHTSAKYPKEESEFEHTQLTPEFKGDFYAPYVQEAVVKMGVAFREEIPIKANGTILLLGEIQEFYFPESYQKEDGFIDLNQAETVCVSGLDAYHLPQELARFEYARPKSNSEKT